MKQQIPIIYPIKPSFVKKKTHMLLKLCTINKTGSKPFHHCLFFFSKLIRMCPVHSGKTIIQKWIFFSVRKCNRSFFRMDPMKQESILHIKVRMVHDQLPLQFELDHCNSLMHFPAIFFFHCIVIRWTGNP